MEELNLKQLLALVPVIADEKNLSEEKVLEVVEQAIAAAWRRDNGDRDQVVRAILNTNTGEATVFVVREVVEEVENEANQVSLKDAKKIKKDIELGGVIEDEHSVTSFGRVAAQTAKQVFTQRLKEAEKEVMITEYESRIGEVVNGNIVRVDRGTVYVELGKGVGIIPKREQIPGEFYSIGSRIKVLIKEIDRGLHGTQLILSRADEQFIIELFRSEVPEMESGAVEIKALAREAGVRTKIAVASSMPGIDPVGTLVGGHGVRIQTVMMEIGDREKIDVISYSENPADLIYNALSPAEIVKVEIDEKAKTAKAFVTPDQQSIAIGRGGQNVQLASALSGYEIDITPLETKAKKVRKNAEDDLLSAIEDAQ
ncbi:MAG: transcription termination factor NusA [Candidatus Nanosyncoccaceae bacterium]|jgi:N utilization substance protein A